MRPAPPASALAATCAALALVASLAAARALTPRLPLTLEGDESVAATDDARAFLFNPAALGLRYPSELLVAFGRADAHHEYNTELATWRRLGFVAQRIRDTSQTYGVAFALGPDRLRFGWTSHFLVAGQPVKQTVGDHRIGVLWRPSPWLSSGFTVARLFQPQFRGEDLARHYTLGLGLRPLAHAAAGDWGTRLTLTGDVTVVDDGEWRQARTQFGLQF